MGNFPENIVSIIGITSFYVGIYCLFFGFFSIISMPKSIPAFFCMFPLVSGALLVFASAWAGEIWPPKIAAFISTSLAAWFLKMGLNIGATFFREFNFWRWSRQTWQRK